MNVMHGKKSADTLRGMLDLENELWGHGGNDDIRGGRQEDSILGGRGDDLLWGDVGNDQILGNTGDDRIYGSVGDDTIWGNDGNDMLSGGKGNDQIWGGRSHDELHGNTGNDIMAAGSGDDLVMGEAGDDVLDGGSGNDRVLGGSGDDFVLASSGSDVYSGGSGFDTLDFARMQGKLTIDLGKHDASVGSGRSFHTHEVSGFEQVIGNDNGNHMTGDRNAQHLVGGAGDDWFRGKLGADVLTGGDGRDTFVYLKKDTADGSVDRITDFRIGEDTLDIADFLKGGKGVDGSIRLADDGNGGTLVQGLVGRQWVDVVVLEGVDAGAMRQSLAPSGPALTLEVVEGPAPIDPGLLA